MPVAEGGVNDPANLITSCLDCNRGKSSTKLNSPSFPNESTIKQLKEQAKQLKAYYDYQSDASESFERLFSLAIAHWLPISSYYEERSMRYFLRKMPLQKVMEAMDIAGRQRRPNYFKYFCAVMHNWIRGIDHGTS